MTLILLILLLTGCASLLGCAQNNTDASWQERFIPFLHKSGPTTIGWVEKITVGHSEQPLKAKFDTGAKTTSIDAQIVKIFEKDGQEHILYRIPTKDQTMTLESKIVEWSKIKTKDGGLIERPVVILDFCIGKQTIQGKVNLADRDHFNYPVLIGRNMLEGNFIIDASKTFSTPAVCTP